MTKKADENPVVREHLGIEVRKKNRLIINVGEMDMVRLIDAWDSSGRVLSIRQIFALQGRPCPKCGNDCISIDVSKGLLTTNIQKTGEVRFFKNQTTQDD